VIFEALDESAKRGELLLVDGGFCHWHLRRDGQLTIREIIVTRPGQGIGTAMLDRLRQTPGATSILAKCPADLPANTWYARRGFVCEGTEQTKRGRLVNVWRCRL
jgi:hypothetical protein